MSSQTTIKMTNPHGDIDICPRFTITNAYDSLIMPGIMEIGKRYAFNAWIKSDTSGSMSVHGHAVTTDSLWKHMSCSFEAISVDLSLSFSMVGEYYVYHPQLEIGDIATDWTPAPEDLNKSVESLRDDIDQTSNAISDRVVITEELLAKLENMISMLVQDENGESLMTQTADGGWTFSMTQYNDLTSALSESISALQNSTGSTDASVKILQDAVANLQESAEYVRIRTYEDEPCIELGEGDSDFKLMITNTRIMFMNGGSIPTYIDTTGLVTQNITISGEIRHSNWIWKQRENGHYSLIRG